MGSGKGKTRRVKTTVLPASTKTSYTPSKWDHFVKNSGIHSVKVWDYYGDDLGDERYMTNDENYLRITEALFADAVAVGAIILPDPYVVEDFEFVVGVSADFIHLGLKDGSNDWDARVFPCFDVETLMSDQEFVTKFLESIVKDVDRVLGVDL